MNRRNLRAHWPALALVGLVNTAVGVLGTAVAYLLFFSIVAGAGAGYAARLLRVRLAQLRSAA